MTTWSIILILFNTINKYIYINAQKLPSYQAFFFIIFIQILFINKTSYYNYLNIIIDNIINILNYIKSYHVKHLNNKN